jgi:NADH-quinone oxidoreductase subunit F/NAD(P)H dehydrogenase (quinone)/NADP-reducing hydrogenase subunit HndC
MAKFTLEDLNRIKEKAAQSITFSDKTYLLICGGTGCHATGSIPVREALQEELAKRELDKEVEVVETGCNGFCAIGPLLVVHPCDIFYQKLSVKDIPELVEQQLIQKKPLGRLLYKDPISKKIIPSQKDIPFFSFQMPRALRNKGLINPESIDDYIARDGYLGTLKALKKMVPEEIIEQVKISGLKGRGGAGFPTGLKWDFAKNSQGDIKYVLCNADEGDPGAFMDRSILEADPHAVLEGMVIAARAINSHQGFIYARTEYPLAIKRLQIAIEQAGEYGLLGENILDSGFDFKVEIYQGAGAFVCGEETALMRSIEGKRGMPRPRPPFPAHKGLWEKPTILNNVETLANIPQIILKGGSWYANVGTETSKGTKVFALSGDVNNIGLVEVPMGTTLRTIVYDIGGGIPKRKKFKAVQLGGPSGGSVPEQHLDTPVDYEAIAKVGAIMGSGGVIVMDENTCMVDMARFFMDFIQDESCGKCTPCREGTRRLLQILERICSGQGRPQDIETLETLSEVIKESALCGLGQTGPNPILSSLRYFRDEFNAHIYEKKCPAKRCVELLDFEVNPEICTKCGLCFRSCPTEAITWKKKEVAVIDKEKCIKCMTCFEKCRFGAIF